MATLWTSSVDARRLASARSAVFLVGSYDGSGNYGDVLQLVGAIQTVRRVSDSPLPVAVIERETLTHHRQLLERYPKYLSGAAFVHYHEGSGEIDDGLVRLRQGVGPRHSVLYFYGGGYLNHWWGTRKAAHATSAERLAGKRRLPVVASGLQVGEAVVAPGGPAHEPLSRASWIGVRDAPSLELLRADLPSVANRTELAGDDATPLLRRPPVPAKDALNLHVNGGAWVTDDADAMFTRIVRLLSGIGDVVGRPLQLRPVIAYEDPRISEREAVARLLDRHGDALRRRGMRPIATLDILHDAVHNDLAGFFSARLTVSCSYHVTLTSLLAGIPAVLLAENNYYDQKAAGLRDLFGLDDRLVGVRGNPADVAAAAEIIIDGPARAALVEHLQKRAVEVAKRCESGRQAVTDGIVEGLSHSLFRGLGKTLKRRLLS